jgi:DNA processing protein
MPLFELPLADFPQLFQVPSPTPKRLWAEGKSPDALALLSSLPSSGVAVVGTRQPRPRSLSQVRTLIEGLRQSRLVVISGLARGIDQAAHEAALVFGLPTVAILGCGIRNTYPEDAQLMREQIVAAGGLVVSEFEPDDEPRPYRFVQRNRLIAGWSAATCVLQAGRRSGSLLTADYALQMHRPVFAAPHFPGEPGFEGNERLLDDFSVHSLWGPHSLGACWLELATAGKIFPA